MDTIGTYNIFNSKEFRACSKDVSAHFHDTCFTDEFAYRRRVMTIADGYYLSILTGSHCDPSVEVALMKDGLFVAHPTDPEWGEPADFSIIDFFDLDKFKWALIEITDAYEEFDNVDMPTLWEKIQWL